MATDLTQYTHNGTHAYYSNVLPDGIPSAPGYDAALITMHCLYHTGWGPSAISTSRGHTYRVKLHNREYFARIVDYKDHRAGVVGIL